MASASFSQWATNRVTLTDAATSLFTVDVAASTGTGGVVFWRIFGSDGTDHQSLSGITTFAAVNKAGTCTRAITNDSANDASALSGGSTLTTAWTCTDDTNKVTVKVAPTGSLTETTYYIEFIVSILDPDHFPVLV